MLYLKQSTASQSVLLGPFVDDTDGATAETGLTIANTDVKLSKNGATMASKNSGGGTHDANGWYAITLDATDTNTVGRLQVSCKVSGALAVWAEFQVLEETVYDALFGSGAAGELAVKLSTQGRADVNAEADTALTDYDAVVPADLPTNFADLSITATTGRVDVGAWVGTAVTLSATSAKPQVDLYSVSDDATAADNVEAVFDGTGGVNLKAAKVEMTNGLIITRSDSDSPGMSVTGNGNGSGVDIDGGATGSGVDIDAAGGTGLVVQGASAGAVLVGGSGSAYGVAVQGEGLGALALIGAANAPGLYAAGDGNGHGVSIAAGATAFGMQIAASGTPDKHAVAMLSTTGNAVHLQNSATGYGIAGTIQAVDDDYAELSAVPAASSSMKDKLNWLFALARNKLTSTATTQTLRNDADSADISTSTHSDSAGTFTRGEWS